MAGERDAGSDRDRDGDWAGDGDGDGALGESKVNFAHDKVTY